MSGDCEISKGIIIGGRRGPSVAGVAGMKHGGKPGTMLGSMLENRLPLEHFLQWHLHLPPSFLSIDHTCLGISKHDPSSTGRHEGGKRVHTEQSASNTAPHLGSLALRSPQSLIDTIAAFLDHDFPLTNSAGDGTFVGTRAIDLGEH